MKPEKTQEQIHDIRRIRFAVALYNTLGFRQIPERTQGVIQQMIRSMASLPVHERSRMELPDETRKAIDELMK